MASSYRRAWVFALAGVAMFTGAVGGAIYWVLGTPNNLAVVAANDPRPPADAHAPAEVGGFPTRMEAKIGDAEAALRLTGTALRTWSSYSFYRIASYCPHDAAIKTPECVRDLEAPKMLVLKMVRNIPDSLFSFSFRKSLRNNDPNQQFEAESKRMIEYVTSWDIREGDEFKVAYVPGKSVTCTYRDGEPLVIENPAFARVIWSIYFGEYHLGDEIKTGLVSLAQARPTTVAATTVK